MFTVTCLVINYFVLKLGLISVLYSLLWSITKNPKKSRPDEVLKAAITNSALSDLFVEKHGNVFRAIGMQIGKEIPEKKE